MAHVIKMCNVNYWTFDPVAPPLVSRSLVYNNEGTKVHNPRRIHNTIDSR